MNDKPLQLGITLTDTLLSEDAISIALEYAETGLDTILLDGVLKEIPFVNSLVAVTEVGLALSDRILVNKLLKFIVELSDVSNETRREMIDRLENDILFEQKVGEHILELLERIEGHRKPQMFARVFSAYASKKIDSTTLLRLNYAIERLPTSEIQHVRPFYNRSKETPFLADEYTSQALVTSGLPKINAGTGGVFHQNTELCNIFLDLELDQTSNYE